MLMIFVVDWLLFRLKSIDIMGRKIASAAALPLVSATLRSISFSLVGFLAVGQFAIMQNGENTAAMTHGVKMRIKW